MKVDISRYTFKQEKNFSSVVAQQGRVQLDADWNEQSAILLHYMRTLVTDIIGHHAGPGESFRIDLKPDSKDFTIASGRYYVDGILCENPGDVGTKAFSYFNQPNYHRKPSALAFPFLAYLDVWERHVTGFEDEDLYEPALDGIDTAGRTQVVWQVKLLKKGDHALANPDDADNLLKTIGKSNARLAARCEPSLSSGDPCDIEANARYRGAENQLYRVEVHTGSRDEDGLALTPTFKWSRDNGTPLFRVQRITTTGATSDVFLADLGRDDKYTLREGDWIELVDDDLTLQNRADKLLRVTSIDRDRSKVSLDGKAEISDDPKKHPLLRRWDQKPKTKESPDRPDDNAVLIVERKNDDDWFTLEDGIQIQFLKPNGNSPSDYRTGDYWLIPARVATGNIIWPGGENGESLPQPPRGIEHHYAPLAIVNKVAPKIVNCRHELKSMTEA